MRHDGGLTGPRPRDLENGKRRREAESEGRGAAARPEEIESPVCGRGNERDGEFARREWEPERKEAGERWKTLVLPGSVTAAASVTERREAAAEGERRTRGRTAVRKLGLVRSFVPRYLVNEQPCGHDGQNLFSQTGKLSGCSWLAASFSLSRDAAGPRSAFQDTLIPSIIQIRAVFLLLSFPTQPRSRSCRWPEIGRREYLAFVPHHLAARYRKPTVSRKTR